MYAPAPPPLPPTSIFSMKIDHGDQMAAARSQLLIDIERGAKLKSVNGGPNNQNIISSNMLNGSPAMNKDPIKLKKDQLQAELCSTLQRRKTKNSLIPNDDDIEAPVTNYKNPNYVIPKNSTIRAIRKQTDELRAKTINGDIGDTIPIKPEIDDEVDNLTQIIAKFPEGQQILDEINRTMEKVQQTRDKPKEKLMISHGKPNFVIKNGGKSVSKLNAIGKEEKVDNIENYSTAIERLKPIDNSTIQLPKIESEQKTSELRKKFETLKQQEETVVKQQPIAMAEPKRLTSTLKIDTKCQASTDTFKSSPLSPRRAQLFKQQKTILNSQITSPTIHHLDGTNNDPRPNFEAKQTVSFSKDLGLTPNRYPDQVKVTVNGKEGNKFNTFMSNVKFIINSNGEVDVEK